MEQLPGIVRSSGGEVGGAIRLGMSTTLAAALAGPFIDSCKAVLPKVTLKFAAADSEALKTRIEANTLDLALVFEDELVAKFARLPLFRQRLYLIHRAPRAGNAASVSLGRIGKMPLILPSAPNVLRILMDRAFAAEGIEPNIAAEADVLSSILSAVQTGIGDTILPKGDLTDVFSEELAQPVLIEPPLYLTASIISSSDYPLTRAGEEVCRVLAQFIGDHMNKTAKPGAEWIAGAISAADTRISK
jgi:LysR family nitrogen assimilation transcriptional regulator